MFSGILSRYNKDTGTKEALANTSITAVDNIIPGTMKLYVQTDYTDINVGDLIALTIGDYDYYMVVDFAYSTELILVDLLTYNFTVRFESTTFKSFITKLQPYMIFNDTYVPDVIDFDINTGRLIDVLVQCQSRGVSLSALTGSIRVVEVDKSIHPEPTVEMICNSWSIC
ncbi:hypothetical protein HNP86_001902 [Methanococcus maripaludis]|uniref:Uncharacterized protein n=1 Tax=Methanococcus maripaludis TaxID=39152 RepID=A0A7J9NXK3_METMI|nr:hypothetical protein [Methanococcus maripaludis]MBA2851743.1 hypothetical protein [Methanococcus maripaludis]